jgi:hypothetical protein
MARRCGKQDADDLVLDEAQPFSAAPAVTIFQEDGLRGGPRFRHLGLQQLRQRGAENVLATGMFFGERIDRGGDPRGIETLIRFRAGLGHNAVHELSR